MIRLDYTPLERLDVPRPVRRVAYVAGRCAGRHVLDLGCYDETALVKRGTGHWLHEEISRVARSVVGVDSASAIPADGLATGPSSRIVRGDVMDPGALSRAAGGRPVEVVVAGELIEHLPRPLEFLIALRAALPGRELVLTTPNATSLTNVLVGLAGRESNHPDHLQLFSYKTLNTLALRAGFERWRIVPYFMYYTEMKLRTGGLRARLVGAAERAVNSAEWLFPLLAGGLILHAERM
jgi:hypothetical protein